MGGPGRGNQDRMRSTSVIRFAAIAACVAAIAAGTSMTGAQAGPTPSSRPTTRATQHAALPVKGIERTLQADGEMSHGVLAIDINRSDVTAVGGDTHSPFVTGFQLQHEIYFQSLGPHRAIVNGDLSLKPSEIQPAIDAMLARGLRIQAEHQHLYDVVPMMWFVHFRGVGTPMSLARKVEAAIRTTSTPQPQSSPAHPTTPLPSKRLAKILGGDATVGDNGVVTVDVDRRNKVTLGGVRIRPGLNIATSVQFEPQAGGGSVAVADIAMTAGEINPVLRLLRRDQWESGCLYNQETAEHPQLYFDHFFKTGGPIALARQIRRALDRTDSES